MQTIALGTSGRETTRLGFGCSSLMGSMGRKDSLATLEAAYDAGIRHFDVAPMYGSGQAEGCLGEFLARHKGQVTVTTKFGIPPEDATSLKTMVRGLARPVLKLLPGIKKKLQKAAIAASTANTPAARLDFSVQKARASLERSLAELKVERIDVWLLHEAEAVDLTDDGLLRLMEDIVAAGKIGTFGVGSGVEKIPALLAERAAYCRTLQYEWSVLDAIVAPGESFRIHHRALTENFRALHEALQGDTARGKRWSDYCGVDVTSAGMLAKLMLKASLVCNPESVILFSSKRAGNIRSNAALVDNASLQDAALRLYSLVRAEAVEVLPAGAHA
jgi:aryl-alcohol dehydrogenase-like predicted oxidoreductase